MFALASFVTSCTRNVCSCTVNAHTITYATLSLTPCTLSLTPHSPYPHRAHTLRPGPSRLPELPNESPPQVRLQEGSKTLPPYSRPVPVTPTEDSETDYSDMDEDDIKSVPIQNGSSPLKSASGSSIPVVAETRVTAVATKGSPVLNGACGNQNETKNTGIKAKESPVILPKSSGSGAIAQHLKSILNKQSPEKESPKAAPKKNISNGSEENSINSKAHISSTNDEFVVVSSRCSIRSTVSSVSETSTTTTDIESSIDNLTPLTSPTLPPPSNKPGKIRWSQLGLGDDNEDDQVTRGYTLRSRTHTLASLHSRGKKSIERGRLRLKDIKKEETKMQPKIKRQSSLTNLSTLHMDYELISPEIFNCLRNKIIRDLEKKYGGADKANKAAAKIQRAYREYKMQSRFKEIRREKHLRVRAQSMRTPGRRPSILGKKSPRKYRREPSASGTLDPVVKAREASKLLTKERAGHNHVGTRLQLAQARRKESQGVLEINDILLEEDSEVW